MFQTLVISLVIISWFIQYKNIVGDEDCGSGPYYITLTAGMTRLPFNISIHDDKKDIEDGEEDDDNDEIFLFEDETFILTIDPSSLPCSLSVGNHGQATVTILEDECK